MEEARAWRKVDISVDKNQTGPLRGAVRRDRGISVAFGAIKIQCTNEHSRTPNRNKLSWHFGLMLHLMSASPEQVKYNGLRCIDKRAHDMLVNELRHGISIDSDISALERIADEGLGQLTV